MKTFVLPSWFPFRHRLTPPSAGKKSIVLAACLVMIQAVQSFAATYTWDNAATGTQNWSTTTNWIGGPPAGGPGGTSSSNSDIANFADFTTATTVVYDSLAPGYLGTLNLTQTVGTVNSSLSLSRDLTIDVGGNIYSTKGNGSSTGLVQVNVNSSTFTIGAGASFTIGTTTPSLVLTSNNQTSAQITNGVTMTSAGTNGQSGAVVINGALNVASPSATSSFTAGINAPVTLASGGSINLSPAGNGGVNRLNLNGNFTSTGGNISGASGSSINFSGSTVNIGAGTTFTGFSGGLQFATYGTLNYAQVINLGVVTPAFTIRNNQSVAGVTMTKTFTSTATSSNGLYGNAINAVNLRTGGAGSQMVFVLGSDLNLDNTVSANAFTFQGLGALVGQDNIDLAGYSYNATRAANVTFSPSAATNAGVSSINILNSGASSIAGGHGLFTFASFNLSLNDIGIGTGVILQAGQAGVANNLGTQASGVTAINANSTFYYTGVGAAATLASNRALGRIRVGDGTNASSLALASALTAGGDVTVSASSVLDLAGNNLTQSSGVGATTGGLNGSGTIRNNTSSSTATLTIDTGAGNGNFSGAIEDHSTGSGTVAVTKNGAGSQVLSGVNTYTGATIVNAGTLLVNGTLSGTASTVVANGTLGGTGSIASSVTVGDGSGAGGSAIFAIGTNGSIGTIATGALSLNNSDAAFVFDIQTSGALQSDLVQVTGGLTLGAGVAQFLGTDLLSAALANGTVITLATTTTGISGTFAGLNEHDIYTLGSNSYRISYGVDTLNDLTLTVVPEPGTITMALGGFAMLLVLRRVRRRVG